MFHLCLCKEKGLTFEGFVKNKLLHFEKNIISLSTEVVFSFDIQSKIKDFFMIFFFLAPLPLGPKMENWKLLKTCSHNSQTRQLVSRAS